MSLNEVIERFTLVSGMEMTETSRFLPLILDCYETFTDHLRGELDASQQRRAAHACAVYAYYRMCLIPQDDGISSFKAGDLSITAGDRLAGAQRLWDEERAAAADLVDFNDGCICRSVRI
jgi:hypothetical protein